MPNADRTRICPCHARATMSAFLDTSKIAFQRQSHTAGCSDCAFWGHLELTGADSGYDNAIALNYQVTGGYLVGVLLLRMVSQ
jgi:hypothetical protein